MTEQLASLAAIVLAAGKGTRMKSRFAKVLHPVLGEPMLFHSLRALAQAGIPPERTVVVIGHQAEAVRQAIQERGNYLFAEQTEQLGTGHAVQMAESVLQNLPPGSAEQVLVLYGDNALIRSQTLSRLISTHFQTNPLMTMATARMDDPTGYGRIIRDETGQFQAIVEQVDLTPTQLGVKEFNPGVYVYRAKWLWPALRQVKPSPKGEYYLTDLAALAVKTAPGAVATCEIPAEEILGVNDRVQLAEVDQILRLRVLREHMLAGVTITDQASTYISAESVIEPDTIIEPNTHLRGQCVIGSGCVIGPNSILTNARVGQDCQILASVIENSTLENNITIGPFSRVRPGSYLEDDVHMGNFAEVSRSRVGTRSKQGHFSFIGDATLGADVNVGAGTITANYDGKNKNKTVIGARVFLGSDTILRAPVTLGDEARTGAGAVVTKDVAPGALVVGVPAKPKE